jgi:hypothetical protein
LTITSHTNDTLTGESNVRDVLSNEGDEDDIAQQDYPEVHLSRTKDEQVIYNKTIDEYFGLADHIKSNFDQTQKARPDHTLVTALKVLYAIDRENERTRSIFSYDEAEEALKTYELLRGFHIRKDGRGHYSCSQKAHVSKLEKPINNQDVQHRLNRGLRPCKFSATISVHYPSTGAKSFRVHYDVKRNHEVNFSIDRKMLLELKISDSLFNHDDFIPVMIYPSLLLPKQRERIARFY